MDPRHVFLGATLALGGCSLAGSSEGPDQTKIPSLASVVPTRPVGVDIADEPDLDADIGRLEALLASPGFVPDPMTREGVTSAGEVELNSFDDRCHGYAASAPDLLVRADRPFAELSVMAASEADLTLMIVGPDGDTRCADDVDGELPVVRGAFGPGVHRVWVGTATPEIEVPFTIALSEYDDSLPSALLH